MNDHERLNVLKNSKDILTILNRHLTQPNGPLETAAFQGQSAVVEELLAAGQWPIQANPLWWALEGQHIDIAYILLREKACLNYCAVDAAVRTQNVAIVQFLLDCAQPEERDGVLVDIGVASLWHQQFNIFCWAHPLLNMEEMRKKFLLLCISDPSGNHFGRLSEYTALAQRKILHDHTEGTGVAGCGYKKM